MITLIAPVQTRPRHLLVQETFHGQVVVRGTDVLVTITKRLNALSRLVVVVVVVIDSVMVFQF